MKNLSVSLLMGSNNDWEVMKHAAILLKSFQVSHDVQVLSAHRTPQALENYIALAEKTGCFCFIAGAGGAAHLAGVIAAKTVLPVLGVPIPSKYLNGMDSLLSTVQMPQGIPVATFAIGEAGAGNAALFAVSMLAMKDETYRKKLVGFRKEQEQKVLSTKIDG